jgi:hypothetical protein
MQVYITSDAMMLTSTITSNSMSKYRSQKPYLVSVTDAGAKCYITSYEGRTDNGITSYADMWGRL